MQLVMTSGSHWHVWYAESVTSLATKKKLLSLNWFQVQQLHKFTNNYIKVYLSISGSPTLNLYALVEGASPCSTFNCMIMIRRIIVIEEENQARILSIQVIEWHVT